MLGCRQLDLVTCIPGTQRLLVRANQEQQNGHDPVAEQHIANQPQRHDLQPSAHVSAAFLQEGWKAGAVHLYDSIKAPGDIKPHARPLHGEYSTCGQLHRTEGHGRQCSHEEAQRCLPGACLLRCCRLARLNSHLCLSSAYEPRLMGKGLLRSCQPIDRDANAAELPKGGTELAGEVLTAKDVCIASDSRY